MRGFPAETSKRVGAATWLHDGTLLDCVVGELREFERRGGLERTLAVGELILTRFFRGKCHSVAGSPPQARGIELGRGGRGESRMLHGPHQTHRLLIASNQHKSRHGPSARILGESSSATLAVVPLRRTTNGPYTTYPPRTPAEPSTRGEPAGQEENEAREASGRGA